MSDREIVFVLNLDADQELDDPSARTSPVAVRARIDALALQLGALTAGAKILREGERAPGSIALAWCPTAAALDRIRAAGAVALPAPSMAVLRRVNHRRFSFDLGPTLPGERWATSLDEVRVALADGGAWLLKAAHGFAGRGQVRLRGELTLADADRAQRLLERSGAQLEPMVSRLADYAIHGFLAPDGALTRGALTMQRCDERGAWSESRRFDDAALAVPFGDELERVAGALRVAGYFGPFGVDGFTYATAEGTQLRKRSEINARYSMGWAIGMGDARPDLDAAHRAAR